MPALPSAALEKISTPSKPNQPQQYSLPNGLRIILLEDHSLPVISTMVWYRVGARNEQPGLTGLSHIVEHLLFQTVGQYRKGELGATIVRNGGQFNGFTSDDFTSFYETLPASKVDLGLKIESERMKSAVFSQADLNEEIGRVRNELDENAKDPSNNLAREVRAAAFIQHPYRNPPQGWKQDLESLTAKDAKEFYERYFRPNNATLVLVGDFKTQPTLAVIGKLFGTIPKGAAIPPAVRITESPQSAERRVIVRTPSKIDEVQIAYHAPAFSDPDAAPMFVLEKLLNAPISGRIKTKLIDPKSIGFGKSAFEIKKDPGLFTIDLTAPTGSGPQKLLDAWDTVVNQLRSTPVSDVELSRARNQAEFAILSDRDGPYKAGFQLGYCETMQSWVKGWTSIDKIRAVNAADLLRVSKRYLNPDSRVIGILTNPAAKPAPSASPSAPKSAPPSKPPANAIYSIPKTPISTTYGAPQTWGYKDDGKRFIWPAQLESKKRLLIAEAQSGTDESSSASSWTSAASGSSASSGSFSASGSSNKNGAKVSSVESSASPSSGQSAGESPADNNAPPKPFEGAPSGDSTGSSSNTTPNNTPASTSSSPTAGSTTIKSSPASNANKTGTGSSTGRAATRTSESKTAGATEKAATGTPIVQKKVLKNGTTVLVVESHLAPIVQISGAIKAGDVFEPTNKKGLSALLVQLLNDGPAKSSRHEIQQQQEDMGLSQPAMLKFENSIETINFQSRCLSKDFLREMNLIGSCLKGLSFEDADCDKAKNDFYATAKSSEDTTNVRVNRALLRSFMQPGSAYFPADPREKAHAVSSLKAPDLKEFAGQHLTPDSAVIVVAGDIAADLAFMQIERSLDGWSNASSKHGALPLAAENSRKVLKVSLPDSDIKGKTLLTVGRLMPSQSEKKDFAALLIADCALTNHPIFSRLAQRLNTDPNLESNLAFEDMESRYVPLSNMVSWSLTVPVNPHLVQKTSTAIQTELKRFAKSGITAEELAEVKRYLASAIPVRMMPSCAETAKHVLTEYLQDAESNIPWQLISRVRATDLATINNFIKTEFKPDQSVLIVAGSGSRTVPVVKPTTEPVGSESGGTESETSDEK
ncbi:MAG TPA: insulinase family protein [Oculatellaceae cyanobacterium]